MNGKNTWSYIQIVHFNSFIIIREGEMALLGSAGCSNMRIWVGVPVPCRKLGAKEGETGGTLELADHLV